ncbi:MAG: DUF4157 domain-containing protein [Hyphomicrobiales bacterium]
MRAVLQRPTEHRASCAATRRATQGRALGQSMIRWNTKPIGWRMPSSLDPRSGAIAGTAPGIVARRCAACEGKEEDRHVHRKTASQTPTSSRSSAGCGLTRALDHGGSPLTARERACSSPGSDATCHRIRVHTRQPAPLPTLRLASRLAPIPAERYRLLQPASFSPATRDGRRLIAHELAHVAQQAPRIARQPAHSIPAPSATMPAAIRSITPRPYKSRLARLRTELREASIAACQRQPQEACPSKRPTRAACATSGSPPIAGSSYPFRIQFQQLQAGDKVRHLPVAPNTTPVNLLPAAQFQNIQDRYVRALNNRLNNRYAAHRGLQAAILRRPADTNHHRSQKAAGTPDATINVVNRGGRGDAGTICVGSFNDAFAMHEGGHRA